MLNQHDWDSHSELGLLERIVHIMEYVFLHEECCCNSAQKDFFHLCPT